MRVDPAAPLADQIRALDYNLEDATAQIAGLAVELGVVENGLKAAMKSEEQLRVAADSEIRETMRRDALGNFGILYFGAFWVLVGSVLSGLAPEMVRLVAGQWEAVLRGL